MKTLLLPIICMGLVVVPTQAADKSDLKGQKEKLSYAMGFNLGNAWKSREMDVDLDLVLQGIRDAQGGKDSLLNDAETRETFTTLNKETREKAQQRAEKNKKESEAFLAANKAKPGVVTMPSGLQYKVLAEGKGETPKSNDVVTVNYRGMLIDGTEFDSSYKRNEPFKRAVNQVIKGWSEALQSMKVGSKWQLFVPPDLAYGASGSPGSKIGPNAALIFEVELLGVQPAPPAPKPTAAAQPITSDIVKVPSAEEMKKGAKIETIKKEDLEKLQKQQQQK